MIGAGERDEAFRMLRGEENVAGIVDADRVVGRRMKYQQRLVQRADAGGEHLLGDIVEKSAADAELPAGERDLDLALKSDVGHLLLEQPDDMRRIGTAH